MKGLKDQVVAVSKKKDKKQEKILKKEEEILEKEDKIEVLIQDLKEEDLVPKEDAEQREEKDLESAK